MPRASLLHARALERHLSFNLCFCHLGQEAVFRCLQHMSAPSRNRSRAEISATATPCDSSTVPPPAAPPPTPALIPVWLPAALRQAGAFFTVSATLARLRSHSCNWLTLKPTQPCCQPLLPLTAGCTPSQQLHLSPLLCLQNKVITRAGSLSAA